MEKMMMKAIFPCPHVREFLCEYLEGRISKVTALRFKMHLAICKPCVEYVQLYRQVADGQPLQAALEPPAELMERTLAFLDSEGITAPDTAADEPAGKPQP